MNVIGGRIQLLNQKNHKRDSGLIDISKLGNFVSLQALRRENLHEGLPVFGSHVRRIGYLRVLVGGGAMYLSLPFLIGFHVIVLWFLYNNLFCRLLGIQALFGRHFIVIDRYKIKNLSWLDRLNCMYCGYANGLSMLFDATLELFRQTSRQRRNGFHQSALVFVLLLSAPFMLVFSLHGYLIYDLIVSRILGMHRHPFDRAYMDLGSDYSEPRKWGLSRMMLCYLEIENMRMASSLEQIESAWCPFKHFKQSEGVLYPKHHENFFSENDVSEVKAILLSSGTVSSNKPYW